MPQESVSNTYPIAVDYDSTLVLAIELSNTSWVLAAQVPGLPRVKAKQSIGSTGRRRCWRRLTATVIVRVQGCRESGSTGCCHLRGQLVGVLAGALAGPSVGVEVHVVQPSSVLVDRRAAAGEI